MAPPRPPPVVDPEKRSRSIHLSHWITKSLRVCRFVATRNTNRRFGGPIEQKAKQLTHQAWLPARAFRLLNCVVVEFGYIS